MTLKYLLPFIVVTLVSCSRNNVPSEVSLQYELSYYPNRIHASLKYFPVESDSSVFIYGEPMFGGQTDIISGLASLKLTGEGDISLNKPERKIIVHFRSHKTLQIDYDIIDTHREDHGLRGELFRPLISADYVYCHGVNLFLKPLFRDSTLRPVQTVNWSGLPPFRLFQSYDPDNDGSEVTSGDPGSFLYRIVTGAKDLIVKRSDTGGTPYYLVLRIEKSPDPNVKAVEGYFEKYYPGIRKFWNDSSSLPYSLVVQQFLTVDHGMSGMSLGNAFVGKYSYKSDTLLTIPRMLVLSHEIGHHWIGGRIDSDPSNQWFGEGFNDYFTYYTLALTGMITPQQFAEGFTSIFRDHYTSKLNSLPNDSVWKNYWKMGEYNRLPYRRGEIFALFLDNQIRNNSGGKNTLHDLMLKILEFCSQKKEGYQLTVKDFIDLASDYVDKKILSDEIEKYIIRGEPLRFKQNMIAGGFRVNTDGPVPVINVSDSSMAASFFR